MTELRFEPGETLFEFGNEGDALFIVADGEPEAIIGGEVVQRVQRGEATGELALIDSEPRSATVVSGSYPIVLSIAKPEFESLWRDQPEVSLALLRYVGGRLRERTVSHHND